MVQNTKPKRGRPRAYDTGTALAQATNAFWQVGFAATSLDDLSGATRMNRPSLYGAFGDKRALYAKTLDLYRERTREVMKDALGGDDTLREALRRAYRTALSFYLPGSAPPRGCFMVTTAVPEAGRDPDVQAALAAGLCEIEAAFAARIRVAQAQGELAETVDPAMLAKLASASLYYLGIHARAGEARSTLEAFAEAAVELICAASKPAERRAPG
jgi:AcrR family transcriptional regulator